MSKTLLVAQREFMENLRTKTFWIGILAAPIGIILFYTMMFLLQDKTDERKYVVLDRSVSAERGAAWVSKAVDAELAQDEFGTIFKTLSSSDAKEEKEAAKARIEKKLKELSADHPLRDLFQRIENAGVLANLPPGINAENLPADTQKKLTPIVTGWVLGVMMDPKKRAMVTGFVSSLAMKDYVKLDYSPEGDDPEKELNKMLQDGKIFAYFVIDTEPTKNEHSSKYVSKNITDFKLRKFYERHVTNVIRNEHIRRLKREKDLADADVRAIQASFTFAEKRLTESGKEDKVDRAAKALEYAPIAFVYILWLTVFIAAQMLLTNTVEEKSNRIIEVLLSSVSPTQLMHGKIYGIAVTGLVIVGSWALFLVTGVKLAPTLFPASAAIINELRLDQIVSNPLYLGCFLAYFLTGYLFYAAILVAIGSVCNSLKEAQNLQQPVMFALFVPLATMFPIASDPNGTLAKVITYIPLYTPFAMMNRAGGPPPIWEFVASSAIIIVSLWLAFRGAAKIFRVGILMTGKPPKITEVLRWVRQR